MSEDKFHKSEQYDKAKHSFEDLNVEEQAVFIVESAVNMLVHSVQKAGDAFSKAFEDMKTSMADEQEADDDQADGEGSKKGKKKGSKKKSAESKKEKKHEEESESD